MSGRPRIFNHERIIALRQEGMTLEKIANIIGTTKHYIWLICKKNKLGPITNNVTQEKRSDALKCIEHILQ